MATTPAVLVDRDGGLVTLTLNRPHKRNAINALMWNELDAAIASIEDDPSARALVLTGAGEHFSSGADLSGGLSYDNDPTAKAPSDETATGSGGLTGHGPRLVVHEMRTVGKIIARLQHLPIPTIAAIDGVAVGVALGMALACDLIIATDRARLMEVFVKRGLALDGGASWTLPRLIGLRRAKQMTFFGDAIDAATALDWGLVNEVVAPSELAATVAAWGQRLADGPTTALSLIKHMLNSSAGSSFEEAIEDEARVQQIVYATTDMAEGIQSFLERREPRFSGS
jgi:2-(1,2-epoxy-1,2-dihydrophenyl)acetyl-CoA isomerase